MATVRKYPKPKGYFRGGRVLQDVSIEGDAPAEAGGFPAEILGDHPPAENIEGTHNIISEPPPPAESSAAEDNPLQRALDAQRRADELQQSTLDREIGKLPLSEFKKQFLRQHPELVTDEFRSKAMGWHYHNALQAGIEDDSPEMSAHILASIDREIAHVRQQAIENVRMPAVSEPEPEPTESRGVPTFAPPAAAPPPAPSFQGRRVPFSAPVTRDVPTYSGKPQSDSKITLTEEERAIARNSYSAPDMTDAQKEYAYAKQKQKLLRLRASGEYRITTEQSG